MSGPKTSHYVLTTEQRKVIEEQILRETEIQSIKNNLHKLKSIIFEINIAFDKTIEVANKTGKKNLLESKIKATQTELNEIYAIPYESAINVSELIKIRKIMDSKISNAYDVIDEVNVQFRKVINQPVDNLFHSHDIEKTPDPINRNDIEIGMDKIGTVSFESITYNSESKLNKIDIENRISNLLKIENLPSQYRDEIITIQLKLNNILNEAYLKNFISLSIVPLEKKCRRYKEEYDNIFVEYQELVSIYTSLCKICNSKFKETVCDIESLEFLKEEIEEIKKEILNEREQSYISHTIDEVMTEMGYDVLGHRKVTRKSGKQFRNELYSFGEGNAVNITYSSDGKIAIELCGIDNIDRVPTETETYKLCQDMRDFCDDFELIEEKLKAKGVLVGNRISILPPESEYAQIINTSDFDLVKEVKKIDVEQKQHFIQNKKVISRE